MPYFEDYSYKCSLRLVSQPFYCLQDIFNQVNGQFTVTKSIGEVTALVVDIVSYPSGYSKADIRWEKQGAETSDFQEIASGTGQIGLVFNPVTVDDAGVYATYFNGRTDAFRFSLTRLIVRGMI